MSAIKHTPGPSEVLHDSEWGRYKVRDTSSPGWDVAKTFTDYPEDKANADLIARRHEVPHDCDDPTCPGPVNKRKLEALEESVKLQSHYAKLLNMYDGGERMTFANADDWLARLDAIARADEAEG